MRGERERPEDGRGQEGNYFFIGSSDFCRFDFCRCSASPPGVNQVDGLPPVPNNTGADTASYRKNWSATIGNF